MASLKRRSDVLAEDEAGLEPGPSVLVPAKKLRSIPFRTSPLIRKASPPVAPPTDMASQWPQNGDIGFTPFMPPPITPADSEDETTAASQNHPTNLTPSFKSHRTTNSFSAGSDQAYFSDEDTDMADFTLPAISSSTLATERIPTPMHSSFFQAHSHTSSDISMASSDADDEASNLGSSDRRSNYRFMPASFRQRRLPSPINEDQIDESRDALNIPLLSPNHSSVLDPLSRLDVNLQNQEQPDLGEGMDVENSILPRSDRRRRGRGGTPLPRDGFRNLTPDASKRMKTIFSMGYRADCEKCINRVPGHYNHILSG